MSSSKMNSITDPLASQKTAAANIGLNNYQTASGNVPALQGIAGNLGQTQQQTLNTQSPLFQGVYNDLNQDVNGQGGPFSALTQNLLGSFDTQQNNTQQQLQQQLQAQGLGGSGAGMAVLGNEGVQAGQARAGLVDQNQVNMMSMADQVSQQLAQQNQQQGYTNPMGAIGAIQSLATPPQFQNVDNTYYTPQSKFQTTADVLSAVSPLIGSAMNTAIQGGQQQQNLTAGGNPSTPPPAGQSGLSLAQPGALGNYYSPQNQSTSSMLSNPQFMQMLMQMGAMGGG